MHGVYLADYFARPSKRSGAWMSALQSGYRLVKGSQPIIYNVMNFAKPPEGQAALLSLDEAKIGPAAPIDESIELGGDQVVGLGRKRAGLDGEW